MPRYFFDTDDGDWRHRDEDGLDLTGPDAARREVLRTLPDLARGVIPEGGDQREIVVSARDEAGRRIYAATLSLMAGPLAEP